MLKFLIIVVLIGYVFYKVGGMVFKVLTGNIGGQQSRGNFQGQNRPGNNPRPKDGNVNIDYVPKGKKGKDFDGGEYVDYEEVK